MTFPILVQPYDGRFQASVLGSPTMMADGSTKEEALAALRANIDQRFATGELVLLDIDMPRPFVPRHVSEEEAESWREACAEAYRLRDEQKAAEFPD